MKFIMTYANWIVAAIIVFNAAKMFLTGKGVIIPLILLFLAVIIGLRGPNKQKSA